MKPCIRCFRTLPLMEFYVHSIMKDGHLNVCKACVKLRVRMQYRNAIEKRRAYEKKRFQDPKRKAKVAEYMRRRRKRNPEKDRAWSAVSRAVRDGRLKRLPCSACGSTEKVQAHHHDYSRPLDIRWLCFRCHREGEHGQRVAA